MAYKVDLEIMRGLYGSWTRVQDIIDELEETRAALVEMEKRADDEITKKLQAQDSNRANYEVRMAAEARADKAERLLCDLTDGGSEFAGSPVNCFEWIKTRLSESTRLTIKAVLARKAAEAERDDFERLLRVHYLPMDCPICHRRRLEYNRKTNLIKCEKCGSDGDVK